MKIIQLTDLHVGLEGEDTLGIDVRSNFQQVLALVAQREPDLLVISGDLCFQDPHRSIYRWVKEQLDPLDLPYELISGNHDDPVAMAEVFGKTELLKKGELYFARRVGEVEWLFLDTTTGAISDPQMEWIREALQRQTGEGFIFMHHPPMFGGVPHMDSQYALRRQEAFCELIGRHPEPVHIFCGHYHVDKVLHRGNMTVYITPSTFFQIDQHQEDFAVDHHRPGWRELLRDDRNFRTATCYT